MQTDISVGLDGGDSQIEFDQLNSKPNEMPGVGIHHSEPLQF
jgi:hypothetical protein